MTPVAIQTAVRWSRQTTPVVTSLFMALLATVPIPVPWWLVIAPGLVLVIVFYWSVHRPNLIPFGALFLLGVLQDSLSGSAMGVASAVFMLVKYLVVSQRRHLIGKEFFQLWAGFALVILMAKLSAWSLASLVQGDILDPTITAVQTGVTIVLFPGVVWLLEHIRRVSLAGVPP
jgi:rod shape-determining protein MreD